MLPPPAGCVSEGRGRALASQFRAVLSAGIHPAGCLCAGGMFAPQLTAAGLEEDVLDYLEPKYDGALLTLLETRRAQRLSPFSVWLRDLDEVALPASDRARLLTDLQAIFNSFSAVSRFVCD